MFLKFANADLLEAQIAVPGGGLLKSAHKAVFNYEPREGFLYVRSRAISNRTNDNYDTWPEDELRQAYATFIGKPVFVNHHNDDVRRKRGVIIDAALHEDIGPDGRPDVWIEVLMEIDAIRFPRLAQAILAGDIERTSMGADVGESECSYCGNVATTPSTYCAHIKSHKGRRLARRNPDGTEDQVLVHEICIAQGEMVSTLRGLVPIESVVVGDMALTRAGWRRVTDARQTGVRPTVKITLSDGTTLRCTEDHLIATAAGWTPAVSLLVGDVDAEATVSVRALAGVHVGVLDGELVTSLAVGLEGMPVIEPVGDGVNQPEMARVDAVALSADVVDFDPLEIMPEKVHHSSVNQSFVVRVATDAPVSIGGSGSLPDQALILGNGSGEQSFQFVQAVCVSHDATVPVYDLTVEGEHEFVANGIVVHNCRKISFFENSVLVEPPADPTALTLGVDARGLASLPEFAHMRPSDPISDQSDDGWGDSESFGDLAESDLASPPFASRRASRQAADLDHVSVGELRGSVPRSTSAASTGGHVGRVLGEGAQHPMGRVVAQGGVAGVPDDQAIGDRTYEGFVAPSVRPNGAALGVVQRQATVSVGEDSTHPRPAGVGTTRGVDLRQVPLHDRLGSLESPADHLGYFIATKGDAYVTLTEEQKARFAGTTVRQDDDGFYCHTHRARGKSYPSIDEIPDGEIGFIESTGAAKNFEEEVQQEMTKMATKKKDRWRKTAGALDYGPLAPGPRAGTRWEGIASTPNSRAYEVTVLWPGDEAPMLSGVFDSEERAQEWAQMCVDAGGRSVLIENAGNFQRVSKLRSEGATQAEADQLLVSLDPEHRRMLEKFVPYTVYGPNYNRSITSNLMDAIRFARRGQEEYFLLAWSKCEAALDIATGGEDNWYYDSAVGQYTKRLAAGPVDGNFQRVSKTAAAPEVIVDEFRDYDTGFVKIRAEIKVPGFDYESDLPMSVIVEAQQWRTTSWTVRAIFGPHNTRDDRGSYYHEVKLDDFEGTKSAAKTEATRQLKRIWKEWESGQYRRTASKTAANPMGQKVASTKLAWGETKAPPQVNTLGITECPVCGTTNQFDSTGRCMTCGHLPAPEPFREPDLEVAQKVDMRDGWVNPNLLSAPAFVPPAEDGAGGEENKSDKQPPVEDADPVQKASSATEVVEGVEGDTMRPAAAIIASQEQQIARLSAENAVLRRRAGLVRTADEENPGQPVPEPAAQAPAQSTDEARAADATTEVTSPGSAITDVAPMTTTDVTTPGAAATDVAPDATQDVTAPVSGGAEMPSYEQSVTLVQPDASGASNGTDRTNAFEEDNSWVQQANAVRARTFACLRLAKLRIQAGLENDDDLVIAQRIEASKPSDDAIRTEIRTLTAVVQRQASTAPRRRAAARTAPSLASTGSPIVSTGSASSFEADPVLW